MMYEKNVDNINENYRVIFAEAFVFLFIVYSEKHIFFIFCPVGTVS